MKKELTERQVERRNAIKETLKSMIAPVIFLAIIGAIIFAVVTYQNAEVPPEIIEPNAYNDVQRPTRPGLPEHHQGRRRPQLRQLEYPCRCSGVVPRGSLMPHKI